MQEAMQQLHVQRMRGVHLWLLTLIALAGFRSAVGAQGVQSGTRNVTLCTAGTQAACGAISITTRLYQTGFSETWVGLRNLQGSLQQDNTGGSLLLTDAWMMSTTPYWQASSFARQSLVLTPNGPVRTTYPGVTLAPTVDVDVYEHRGFILQTSQAQAVQDPQYGTLYSRWGVGGCDLYRRFLNAPGEPPSVQWVSAYDTCGSAGYTGSVDLYFTSMFAPSANYLDNIIIHFAFGAPSAGPGVGTYCGTIESSYQPLCTIVSDTYVGDTFNNPTVTPEPATLFLVGTGVVGIAGWVRHRRRRRSDK
jgi:hypothetical protein